MGTTSIWRGTATASSWPALDGELSCDVAIVGGGITGISLAWRLVQEGRTVALLEAATIGAGSTGNSTGNLYQIVEGGLHAVADKWGIEAARAVARSRGEAIELIEGQAARIGDSAGFRRCPMYWYSGSASGQALVEREYQAARLAGLSARRQAGLPAGPAPARGEVLVIEDQAQFHPMAYLQGLAARTSANGGKLFCHSPVIEIDRHNRVLRTARGTVHAAELVLATHSPSGFHLVHTGLLPRREYGLAMRVPPEAFAPGVFWDRGEPPLSVRGVETAEASWLVCVGASRSSGRHDPGEAMRWLESLARHRYPDHEIAFRWSAQNFRSPDGLPYIGRDASGLWIATGFATDGLVYGTLAASIIADEMAGRDNRWSALYRAGRIAPVKGARGLLEETASVTRALVHDYLTDRQRRQLESLAPGQGSLVELNGEKLAVYRDPQGALHAVSSVCTHMGCRLHWNELETTWDCPCHGSRFAPDGRVLEGPAIEPLRRRLLPGSDPQDGRRG